MLDRNRCAAVTSSALTAHPNKCKTESTNTYQKKSILAWRKKDNYLCENAGLLLLLRLWLDNWTIFIRNLGLCHRPQRQSIPSVGNCQIFLPSSPATFIKNEQPELCTQKRIYLHIAIGPLALGFETMVKRNYFDSLADYKCRHFFF